MLGWRFGPFGIALVYAVMLAGCASEGTVRVLSYFGAWTGVTGGRRPAPHRGVDFDAPKRDPVIAAADGKVVRIIADGMCGNGIAVQHTDDEVAPIWTRYCHMDETNVHEGQTVKRGDVLGKVGTTGSSSGVPHLHFELWSQRPGGEFDVVDPLPLIVGCYPALEADGRKPGLVLTYPIRCAGARR
jgi:murein DD-endopeptidase MepM/ murein hydrolase activator NlpD